MPTQMQTFDKIDLLLIEAFQSDAVLVKANLRCSEHPKFVVRHEETCAAGIEAISESDFDLIVLDLMLPDSSGLETLRAVREFAKGTPIVVLSEFSNDTEALEVIHVGAQDCFEKSEAITKPLGEPLRHSIERYHRQHAQRDIASAAFVQSRLFPAALPPIRGFDVGGRCDPSNQVGGDYFDYFVVDDDQLIVVIGDVTGHGFGPSLVMAETRAALRTMAATTSDIGVMIDQVNELISEHDFSWFVTLFLGRIDTKTGRCWYASAGQPAVLKRANRSLEELDSPDQPLGIEPGVKFGVHELCLRRGDTMLLYTDGISERTSGPNVFFGVDRLQDALLASDGCSATETVDFLFDTANRFAENRTAEDDMTAVVIHVNADESDPNRFDDPQS